MKRHALALLLTASGCTADFFVGPQEAGSSGSETSSTNAMPADEGPGGSTSSQPDPTTPRTSDPVTSDGTTSDDPTLASASETETDGKSSETTDPGASASTTSMTGETEEPGDCVTKDARPCELAFPICLWDGENCSVNECNIEGELDCLEFSPECVWQEGACIPSGCEMETECSGLDIELCGMTKGCVGGLEMCFSLACAPCTEVEDPKLCAELPNCAYNEGREACLAR